MYGTGFDDSYEDELYQEDPSGANSDSDAIDSDTEEKILSHLYYQSSEKALASSTLVPLAPAAPLELQKEQSAVGESSSKALKKKLPLRAQLDTDANDASESKYHIKGKRRKVSTLADITRPEASSFSSEEEDGEVGSGGDQSVSVTIVRPYRSATMTDEDSVDDDGYSGERTGKVGIRDVSFNTQDDAAVDSFLDSVSSTGLATPVWRPESEVAMEHQRIQIDSLQLTSPNGLTHTVQTRHVHDADEIDNDEYGYLDEAEIQGRNRYFMEEKEVICRKCHRAGHIAKDCTTVTCMVCGEDGHMSKDCKLNGKVCHACNMRGHVVNECPLRANGGGNGDGRHQPRPQACDRCSSRTHHTEECATIWRRYVYTGPRPPKYSDVDAWCYNCAAKGHFGDDCSLPRVRGTLAFQGDTAFSSSNCPGKIIHVTSARQPPPAHYDNSRSYQYSSPSGGSSQNREERRREQGYSSRHRSSGSRSSHGPRNPSSASTSSRWSNKDNGTSSSKRPSHRSGQSSGSSQTQHRRF